MLTRLCSVALPELQMPMQWKRLAIVDLSWSLSLGFLNVNGDDFKYFECFDLTPERTEATSFSAPPRPRAWKRCVFASLTCKVL